MVGVYWYILFYLLAHVARPIAWLRGQILAVALPGTIVCVCVCVVVYCDLGDATQRLSWNLFVAASMFMREHRKGGNLLYDDDAVFIIIIYY